MQQNSSTVKSLMVFGTRPEAIKMAPIIQECQQRPTEFETFVCVTGQHRQMLDQVIDYFNLPVHFDLNLMKDNQSLSGLTARCIDGLDRVIQDIKPHYVVAQGDTTTVFSAALTAFYHKVKFVHIEAGLRTKDIHSPWPEEMNRRFASLVTSIHCAPTMHSADALRKEGIPSSQIHVTGNTVIDSLLQTAGRESDNSEWIHKHPYLKDRQFVLVTAHRRENFGGGLDSICSAIATLASSHPQTQFVFPVHLNPNVRETVHRVLGTIENVHLIQPVAYPEMVWLMSKCELVLTDSGGIQEEAPSLRKPVVVMRESTERPEAVQAGAAVLVGTSKEKITATVSRMLNDPEEIKKHQIPTSPYGDGTAAKQIVNIILKHEKEV